MNKTKILAAVMAAVLALSLTACGSKPAEESTTLAETEAQAVTELSTVEMAEESATAEPETQEAPSEAADETKAEAAETTEAATEEENKTPETKAEIIDFYKKAAAETDKSGINAQTKMTMEALNGGDGAAGSLINLFKPIAQSALEKNSSTTSHVPGGYTKLVEGDVASATAKDDGKYTTVHMTLNQQVDGMNGKSDEGHVGHAVSVLPGLQSALDELKGLDLDTSEGKVTLTYRDAYVDAKIDNATGKIVSGTWHFKVDILISNCKAKIGIVSAPLNNTTGTVEYTISL